MNWWKELRRDSIGMEERHSSVRKLVRRLVLTVNREQIACKHSSDATNPIERHVNDYRRFYARPRLDLPHSAREGTLLIA